MSDSKIHILIVDDSKTIRHTIAKHLAERCITHEATDGEAALEHIENNPKICLVYADMHMPGMNGMQLLDKIRSDSDERIASLPIIMITGHEDSNAAKRATYNMGATDFISKPFDADDILKPVETYGRICQQAALKNGEDSHHDAATQAKFTFPIDVNTGLLDKNSFIEHGVKSLAKTPSNLNESSLIYLQSVGVSEIFNQHGETITTQIIQSVAKHLNSSLRPNELLAHHASGMFSLFMPGTNAFKANIVAIRMQKLVNNLQFELADSAIRIKLAIGISSTGDDEKPNDFSHLCQHAEDALQMSLEHPKNVIVRYDETYEKRISDAKHHENDAARKSRTTNSTPTFKVQHRSEIGIKDINHFLPYLLSREFDKIPANYLEQMIKPMEDLLEYAAQSVEKNSHQK